MSPAGPRLPGATWRPVSYANASGTFTAPNPLGWILHVVVGNGSPWGTFEHAPAGSRRFSTGWVAKDGAGEQYTELTSKPWAQAAGNGQYWAFETEGYPTEPLTAAQIDTLARWHNHLGAPDHIADTPGQPGIGVHYMGGQLWGGHPCPDPAPGAGPRSHQRQAILDRAKALRGTTSTPARPKGSPDMILCTYNDTVWLVGVGAKVRVYDPSIVHTYAAAGVPSIAVDLMFLNSVPTYLNPADVTNAAKGALLAAITAAQKAGGTPEQIAAATVAELVTKLA